MSYWKGRARTDGRTHSVQLCVVFALLLAPLAHASEGDNAAKAAAADVKTAEAESAKPPSARVKRLLVLDPTANHVDDQTVQIVSGLLTVELAALGDLEVISGTDVRRMMDLEVAKENLGCSADSCLSEIADAFGTDLVVFGNIGRLGELYILTLDLFETATAKSKGRISVRTRTIEELPEKLADELPNLMASVRPRPKVPAASEGQASGNKVVATTELGVSQNDSTGKELPQLANHGSRTAMTVTGVVLGVGGLAGAALGLVPWFQYMMAREAAERAIGDGKFADFESAKTDSEVPEKNYESWGQILVGTGLVSLGLGAVLAVGANWLSDGEVTE